LQIIDTLQIPHTAIVHDCVQGATTKIKRVTNMVLKTGKNGYRKWGFRKDKKRYMRSPPLNPAPNCSVFPPLGLATLTQNAASEQGTACPLSAALIARRECWN